MHPEDGEPIKAGIGRFGPYVLHGKTYANVENIDEVFTIGLNRAVTLIAEKIAKGPRKGRFGADPGQDVPPRPCTEDGPPPGRGSGGVPPGAASRPAHHPGRGEGSFTT